MRSNAEILQLNVPVVLRLKVRNEDILYFLENHLVIMHLQFLEGLQQSILLSNQAVGVVIWTKLLAELENFHKTLQCDEDRARLLEL